MLLLAGDAPHAGLAAVFLLPMASGLALRRVEPLGAALLTTAAFAALQPLGRPINDSLYSLFFVLLFVLYSAGRHLEGRRLVVAAVATWALSFVGVAIDATRTGSTDFTFAPLVTAPGPIALGRFIRHRARAQPSAAREGGPLRRERDAQAERAAAAERTRIAGELHDVVAHAMSAMVVQAAGARRLAQQGPRPRARGVRRRSRQTGREALTEIRRLLGVLRRDDEEIALAPQPSLRHLAALVQRTRAAGLPVELEVEGDERAAAGRRRPDRLPARAGGAERRARAGRAPAARGSSSATGPTGVDLEVLDDGTAGDGQRRLAGVRERVGALRRPAPGGPAGAAAGTPCARGCPWEARRERAVAAAAPARPRRSSTASWPRCCSSSPRCEVASINPGDAPLLLCLVFAAGYALPLAFAPDAPAAGRRGVRRIGPRDAAAAHRPDGLLRPVPRRDARVATASARTRTGAPR